MIAQGATYDLTIYQGARFEQEFALRQADGETVIPLTGYTGHAQIRERPGTTEELATFTVEVGEEEGTVTLILASAQTAALVKDGYYDVFLRPPEGDDLLFLQGRVRIDPRVTVAL